jgi:hypothetical protein
MSDDVRSKIKQLEELMQEIHECSFDEYEYDVFRRTFDLGLCHGYRLGTADGRRAAKGLKNDQKRRGRPSVMENDLRAAMLLSVSEAQANGRTVKTAIDDFWKSMRAVSREPGESIELPSPPQMEGVYFRDRRSPKSGFPTDDVLRTRIRDLKKSNKPGYLDS